MQFFRNLFLNYHYSPLNSIISLTALMPQPKVSNWHASQPQESVSELGCWGWGENLLAWDVDVSRTKGAAECRAEDTRWRSRRRRWVHGDESDAKVINPCGFLFPPRRHRRLLSVCVCVCICVSVRVWVWWCATPPLQHALHYRHNNSYWQLLGSFFWHFPPSFFCCPTWNALNFHT